MSAVTFTTDQVIKGISNCSNTKAFGPDKLSIFHLKNLGHRAIEYLTALFNYSVTWFQRLPPARGGTAQKKIIHLANWSQLIHPGPASSLTKVFLVSSQSCVSTLTHYSSELLPSHHVESRRHGSHLLSSLSPNPARNLL